MHPRYSQPQFRQSHGKPLLYQSIVKWSMRRGQLFSANRMAPNQRVVGDAHHPLRFLRGSCRNHAKNHAGHLEGLFVGALIGLAQHSLSRDWKSTTNAWKSSYQPSNFDRRYSKVARGSPFVKMSPSCSTVSIFRSLMPRRWISSRNHTVDTA